MIIKNAQKLATTPLRKDALEILDAGYSAINPKAILTTKITIEGEVLKINGKPFNLRDYRNIYIAGIGKASLLTATYLESLLGSRITDGVVIDIRKGKLKNIRTFKGTHPLPSEDNIKATDQMIDMLSKVTASDLVITIISGGGSALLCKPILKINKLQGVFNNLLKSGANIEEMNTVRKHLSQVHGGNLARIAFPATVIGLLFSDIPVSDLSVIASGPTFMDKSSISDAEKIINKYHLPDVEFQETPKDTKYFTMISNFLILSNISAIEGMKDKAIELGYETRVITNQFQSDANTAGEKILEELTGKKQAIIVGGETTVKVTGKGKGGRNQHLVLAALKDLKPGQLIASIASDGKDNIEEAAGAIGDQETIEKMEKAKLDPKNYIEKNDSYNFFKKIDDNIITGPTGTNVSDLMLALSE